MPVSFLPHHPSPFLWIRSALPSSSSRQLQVPHHPLDVLHLAQKKRDTNKGAQQGNRRRRQTPRVSKLLARLRNAEYDVDSEAQGSGDQHCDSVDPKCEGRGEEDEDLWRQGRKPRVAQESPRRRGK